MAERPSLLNGGAGPNTLQNDGGMPEQTRGFTVREKEDSPRPDSNKTWNTNMGNPVGPK